MMTFHLFVFLRYLSHETLLWFILFASVAIDLYLLCRFVLNPFLGKFVYSRLGEERARVIKKRVRVITIGCMILAFIVFELLLFYMCYMEYWR